MDPLFHQDVVVATLASGSRGNCTYVGDTRSGVLVDCGISARQVLSRLEAVGLAGAYIDAVLLTHEHRDHVGGARVLDEKLAARQGARVPFYATRGTRSALDERCAPSQCLEVEAGQHFRVGRIEVEPYGVPHDTREPVSYLLSLLGLKVGVLTDLGTFTEGICGKVAQMDIGVVEFNHDLERLMDGPYPDRLKARVRGNKGHLSNTQAAAMLAAASPQRLRHLVLGHLSEENNTPELALAAAVGVARSLGRPDLEISIACQDRPTGPIRARHVPKPVAQAPRKPPASKTEGTVEQLALFPA